MKQRLFGRRGRLAPVAGVVVLVALLAMPLLVLALSVAGSNFEIDTNANLKVDGTAPPALDWANVTEFRQTDLPSGSGDNSFTQGSKEDTPVPTVEFGSIPPNKSDLKTFGVYQEENADGKFLHLFWTRVQDPSGTTNMDFEFNQSSTLSANGVTPLRTVDDLLITYDLARGGTVPTISIRYWNGSAWGPAQDLTASGIAVGSINSSLIPAGESDGLGALDPRTFGEASIGLDAAFGDGECKSFGSAYLKSRSSDSFTAALKDFIAPIGISVSNCGGITIVKDAVPNDTQDFHYAVSGPSGFSDSFDLDDDGNGTLSNTRLLSDLFAGTYTFTESAYTGWDATGLTCIDDSTGDPFAGAVIDPNNRVVAVTIEADDEVTCTFVNTKGGNLKLVKNTVGGDGTFTFSHTITGLATSLTTSGGTADDTSDVLTPGSDYAVSETVPAGWDLTSAACTLQGGGGTGTVTNAAITGITVEAGKTTTCTFTNTKRGNLKLVKNTVGGDGTFTFSHSIAGLATSLTTSGGTANDTSDALVPGSGYAVSETVPAGWDLTSAACTLQGGGSTGTVTNAAITGITVEAGKTTTCTFTNTKRGAISIEKRSTKTGNPLVSNAGAVFSVNGSPVTDNGAGDEDSAVGKVCVSNLLPGNYTINETTPPSGYGPAPAGQANQVITAVAGTDCASNKPTSGGIATFTNPPRSTFQVNFRDEGSGETSATITCTPVAGTGSAAPVTGWDTSWTVSGVNAPIIVTCVIDIDP